MVGIDDTASDSTVSQERATGPRQDGEGADES